jgi:hypothetical protein
VPVQSSFLFLLLALLLLGSYSHRNFCGPDPRLYASIAKFRDVIFLFVFVHWPYYQRPVFPLDSLLVLPFEGLRFILGLVILVLHAGFVLQVGTFESVSSIIFYFGSAQNDKPNILSRILLNRFFYISRLQNAGWSRDRCGKICVS